MGGSYRYAVGLYQCLVMDIEKYCDMFELIGDENRSAIFRKFVRKSAGLEK